MIVAILNRHLRDYVRTTPVTLQIPDQAGIEPDHCFWLNNWAVVSGKSQIDLATDPPPVKQRLASFSPLLQFQAIINR
ncbi:hypothetical protein C8255_03580 [filamentous cyanobacterium CCP3]|nr:hypothetical protein C8255_03580 [filamentous cyanobacterium CCP3]